jgi:hypothetical protein
MPSYKVNAYVAYQYCRNANEPEETCYTDTGKAATKGQRRVRAGESKILNAMLNQAVLEKKYEERHCTTKTTAERVSAYYSRCWQSQYRFPRLGLEQSFSVCSLVPLPLPRVQAEAPASWGWLTPPGRTRSSRFLCDPCCPWLVRQSQSYWHCGFLLVRVQV